MKNYPKNATIKKENLCEEVSEIGFLSNLFSKKECSFCGTQVSALKRDALVNKEGYICKECSKKCSALVKVGRMTKEQVLEHIKYMEEQQKLFEEAFEPIDKSKKQRFVCVETGVEFADEIAMFRYISPAANKRINHELFRYDQIKNYEPYTINNNSQDGKKYSEVGIRIILNCSFTPDNKDKVGNRSYHPYVEEIKVPRHKNVDDFYNDPMMAYLDKLFGRYEDTSLVGGIKSSLIGTNKEREQMKVAAEGLKALGSIAKSKKTGKEEDASAARKNVEKLKNDALDLATGNRATYTKIANSVEKKILGK